jgi:hypothetical protein
MPLRAEILSQEGLFMKWFMIKFLVAISVLLAAIPSRADQAPALLTLSGKIAAPNQGDLLVLDAAALDALPQVTIETDTPWTDGRTVFEGVSLAAVLALAGADGVTLRAIALNDYAVDIPVSDLTDPSIIIARSMNGAALRVRDFGPLWIVYPLSDNPKYRNEATHSKMIWQLNRIEIR